MEMESENPNHPTNGLINIILCGAPGSGKGTQSDLIIKKYNLLHISSGELLRKEIAEGTELGKEAEIVIGNGQLVRDEMIIKMIEHQIETLDADLYNGVIFDGFPRTLAQAESLERIFNEHGTTTDLLINLQVDEDELVKRILSRGKTSGRNDDNLETIRKRFDVYEKQTKPIIGFYKNIGKYAEIDGMGTMEEVFERITKEIDAVVNE